MERATIKTISKQKLKQYFNLTSKALEEIKKKISKDREKDAKEIIEMVSNYLSDAKYFESKGDYISAFAAINYAHGWIDCGVRLGVFKVKDRNLFTIP